MRDLAFNETQQKNDIQNVRKKLIYIHKRIKEIREALLLTLEYPDRLADVVQEYNIKKETLEKMRNKCLEVETDADNKTIKSFKFIGLEMQSHSLELIASEYGIDKNSLIKILQSYSTDFRELYMLKMEEGFQKFKGAYLKYIPDLFSKKEALKLSELEADQKNNYEKYSPERWEEILAKQISFDKKMAILDRLETPQTIRLSNEVGDCNSNGKRNANCNFNDTTLKKIKNDPLNAFNKLDQDKGKNENSNLNVNTDPNFKHMTNQGSGELLNRSNKLNKEKKSTSALKHCFFSNTNSSNKEENQHFKNSEKLKKSEFIESGSSFGL